MKFINLFALLFTALFFTACASTDEAAPASAPAESVETQNEGGAGLLMDQYKTGEIPGFRD